MKDTELTKTMKLTNTEKTFYDEYIDVKDRCRFDAQGGYPSQRSFEIPGYVVVATVDHDNAPTLEIHKVEDLKQAIKDAKKYMKENPEMSILDALAELA